MFESVPRSSGHLRRQVLMAVAVAAVLWFALSDSPGRFLRSRRATPREDVLYFFAQQTGDPALCDQISWRVYVHNSWMFATGGGSYLRSDCYERSAEARQQPSICWKVRPLLDFEWPSPGYSAWACRRRTLRRERSSTALTDEVLVHTFERMGYDIDHMPSEAIFSPAILPRDIYWSLANNQAAVARAEQALQEPSSPVALALRQSDDRLYVANFVAIATSDPTWCDHIPTNFHLKPDYPAFRDTCLYGLAINRHDAGICALMTPTAQDPKVINAERHGMRAAIAEQLTLHAECDHHFGATSAASQKPHYSAELPADPKQIMRLVLMLNGAMPSARNWPIADKARYFQNHLFGLWPQEHDAIHNAVRAELVRRLLGLPEDPA